MPFSSRFLNTRTMKETFKSFVELLISVALDADVMSALERENGGYTPNRGGEGDGWYPSKGSQTVTTVTVTTFFYGVTVHMRTF